MRDVGNVSMLVLEYCDGRESNDDEMTVPVEARGST